MLRHYPDGDAELVRRAYAYAAEAHAARAGEAAADRAPDHRDLRAAGPSSRHLADQMGARGPGVQVPRARAIQGGRGAPRRAAPGPRTIDRPGDEDACERARARR